jgi:Glycosyltransferase family 87
MDRDAPARLARTALPIVAVLLFVGGLALTLSFAGETLGYDFKAYHQAIVRLFEGQPLYDMSYTQTGGFGLFYYPPTFAPLLVPFGFIGEAPAIWIWIALSILTFLIGVAILPVSRAVRWWIVLLAGLSFPFVYAVKLGQVGPVLLLLMAIGWRWLDSPIRLGASAALGAAIKLQPGLILAWALLTRRFRAVAIGAAVLVALAVLATLLAGTGAWTDFLTLVRTVSDPIATRNNLTPGAVAYQLGVPALLRSSRSRARRSFCCSSWPRSAGRAARPRTSRPSSPPSSSRRSCGTTTRPCSCCRWRTSWRPGAGGRWRSRWRRRGRSWV